MGDFLLNHLALVAVWLASGAMLLFPELLRMAGGSSQEVGTLEATRLMNQPGTLVLEDRKSVV